MFFQKDGILHAKRQIKDQIDSNVSPDKIYLEPEANIMYEARVWHPEVASNKTQVPGTLAFLVV
jgi:hypothetical protein